jgi:hypothetical protein
VNIFIVFVKTASYRFWLRDLRPWIWSPTSYQCDDHIEGRAAYLHRGFQFIEGLEVADAEIREGE